jgi:PAS domain S-box-containing protein
VKNIILNNQTDAPLYASKLSSKTVTNVSVTVMVIAATALMVWIFNIPVRQTVMWHFIGVKFNTALCLLLISTTLYITQCDTFKYRRLLLLLMPVVVLVISYLSLSEYLFGVNIGIDELLVREGPVFNKAYPIPGRMAFNTSAELIYLASGFLLLQIDPRRIFIIIAQMLFHVVTILAAIGLVGFLYGVSLYHSLFYISAMDIHTSIIFAVLSMSALLLNPGVGIVKLFVGDEIGYRSARGLFILITVLVLAHGALRLQLQRYSPNDIELGVAVMIVCFLLAMLFIMWRFAMWMNKADDERSKAEDKVRVINANLEKLVEERWHELRKSEAKYRSLIEQASDAIYVVDPKGNFTDVNDSTCKMLGYSREELVGMNMDDIADPEELKHDPVRFGQNAVRSIIRERKLKKKNGLVFDAEINVKMFTDDRVMVIARDITERKIAEQELKKLNENLEQQAKELKVSNDELEQFAYVASHDLQEPLRMVTSFLTRLESKYNDLLDEKGKQYIHFATDGAKRMRQLILDLLAYSRVGRADMEMEEVDVAQLVDEALKLYKGSITKLKAKITCNHLPVLRGYKPPLMQVIQNVISNSLKYHKAGVHPVIEINCNETSSEFEFSVKDNGIGIDNEHFDKIFIVFQRLHNRDEYTGTGMGLAITKKIVESMGGKIWVESEENKGATFYFTIPK